MQKLLLILFFFSFIKIYSQSSSNDTVLFSEDGKTVFSYNYDLSMKLQDNIWSLSYSGKVPYETSNFSRKSDTLYEITIQNQSDTTLRIRKKDTIVDVEQQYNYFIIDTFLYKNVVSSNKLFHRGNDLSSDIKILVSINKSGEKKYTKKYDESCKHKEDTIHTEKFYDFDLYFVYKTDTVYQIEINAISLRGNKDTIIYELNKLLLEKIKNLNVYDDENNYKGRRGRDEYILFYYNNDLNKWFINGNFYVSILDSIYVHCIEDKNVVVTPNFSIYNKRNIYLFEIK